MSLYAKAMIALGTVTLTVYLGMVVMGARHLLLGPDNLPPFDLRVLGYTFLDALNYLELLTEEQAAFYTGRLRQLDTVFPVLMGLLMGMGLWAVTSAMHPWSRLILLVVPSSYAVMDLCENALIAEMVAQGPETLDRDLVTLASTYTMSKYVTLFVAFALLLAMIVRHFGLFGLGARRTH
ncbi:hypothetical protein [Shimia sp. SDUM112013]|uniref:hypothetical protein n=1 Tax=Shimia sp. SDUM112013 TaxID=3136160 RepID=UPI0032ED7AE5